MSKSKKLLLFLMAVLTTMVFSVPAMAKTTIPQTTYDFNFETEVLKVYQDGKLISERKVMPQYLSNEREQTVDTDERSVNQVVAYNNLPAGYYIKSTFIDNLSSGTIKMSALGTWTKGNTVTWGVRNGSKTYAFGSSSSGTLLSTTYSITIGTSGDYYTYVSASEYNKSDTQVSFTVAKK